MKEEHVIQWYLHVEKLKVFLSELNVASVGLPTDRTHDLLHQLLSHIYVKVLIETTSTHLALAQAQAVDL